MTLDEQMYEELHRRAGLGKIRSFNESPVGRRLTHDNLDAGYRRMAQDAKREAEAAD